MILQPELAAQISQRLSISTPNSAGFEQLPKRIQKNANLFPSESLLANCERVSPVGEFEDVYDRYWTQLTSS